MFITKKKLSPGKPGTKNEFEKYGKNLVYVRYKYDAENKRKIKTIELVAEDKPWNQNLERKPFNKKVFIKIEYDERESIKLHCDITRKWWEEESKNFDIYVSLETIAELDSGNYPRKNEILEFAREIEQLEPNPEIRNIVEFYIQNTLMPLDEQGDALHLAYTSYYKIDFLLTWNCNHLANANKKQHIRIINARLNLFIPEIITPLELFTEREE